MHPNSGHRLVQDRKAISSILIVPYGRRWPFADSIDQGAFLFNGGLIYQNVGLPVWKATSPSKETAEDFQHIV